MQNERYNNFDLLRIAGCVAVIMIHVSAIYEMGMTDTAVFGRLLTNNIYVLVLYDTLSRFAVPSFVMLTGAFALDNVKNANYGLYYKKIFINVGIPTIIFSILYFIYNIVGVFARICVGNADYTTFMEPIRALIKGEPFYHMWYLYMMIVLYCLVPIIVRIRKDISNKIFNKVALIIMIVSTLSGWTTIRGGGVHWGVKSFSYLGYFLLGVVVKEKFQNKGNNIPAICMISLGFTMEILLSMVQYQRTIKDMGWDLLQPLNPLIAIISVVIYIGFSVLKVESNYTVLASRTFLIYLIHAGVWDVIRRGVQRINPDYGYIIMPISVLVVLAVSFGLSIVYEKIWKWLNIRFLLTERICNRIFG